MRALITGASGFAGTALVRHLAAVGDDVIGWSRSSGDPDITDRAAVFDAIASANPDVIYHLAAQSHVPTSWEDPVTTLRVNVEGTQNLLDAAGAMSHARIVVVTSAEVYGAVTSDQLPITEDAPLRPSNPYASSKAAADSLALGAHLGTGLDVIRIRAFNHFGPGQATSFVSSGFAHRIASAAAEGKTTIDVGNLDVRRDFCDVRDVVRAYRLAATEGAGGEVYNVCSGTDRSIRELATAFVARSGSPVALNSNPDLERPVDTPVVRGSAARLFEHTGWVPEVPFETSVDDIYADAVNRLKDGVQAP